LRCQLFLGGFLWFIDGQLESLTLQDLTSCAMDESERLNIHLGDTTYRLTLKCRCLWTPGCGASHRCRDSPAYPLSSVSSSTFHNLLHDSMQCFCGIVRKSSLLGHGLLEDFQSLGADAPVATILCSHLTLGLPPCTRSPGRRE
jgi:hypothetical protein